MYNIPKPTRKCKGVIASNLANILYKINHLSTSNETIKGIPSIVLIMNFVFISRIPHCSTHNLIFSRVQIQCQTGKILVMLKLLE